MKREEAIDELTVHFEHWKRLKNEHIVPTDECENTINALRMAIEALQAQAPPYCVLGQRPPWSEPKTWHEKNGHTYICGDCGFEQAIYGNINEYNCCPRCGVYKEYVDYGGIFPQKRTPYREDGEA